MGEPLTSDMSLRDIEAATGIDRSFLSRCIRLARVPELETAFAKARDRNEPVTTRQFEILARRRAGKSTEYVRRCPHCNYPLRIEDTR
jgi:hypothetical protein